MSWENDATGYLAELSRQTGGQQPATIGQVWDSEWKRGGLDTIAGVGQPFGDARQDLVTAIETASGRPIEDYAAQMGVRLGSGVTQAEDIRLLGSLADTLPEDKRKTVEPLKDVRLNAARKAQKIEADADEIGNATYGLSGVATAFIAGVARQAADPVNVATMVATAPLGAARGASLLATIGREAGANAAAQVAIEPVIEPQRERLGLESGFGRAATNVLEAGIGGGVLSGLFHVAGRGLRTLRGERPAEAAGAPAPVEGAIVPPEGVARTADPAAAAVARPDPVPAGPLAPVRPVEQFAPDDFHAAGDLAERDHVIDVMAPADTAEAKLDHAAEVEMAARRIDSVERIEPPPRMQLVRDQFGENTIHKGAGDIHSYSINGPDGSNVGFAEFAIDGNTARVLDISSFAFNGDRELYGNVRNSLGTRQMRDLLSQFRELHPEVEKLTADRVSGARKGGAYDAGLASTEIEVSLPPRRSEMAATLEGRAEIAERPSPVVVDVAPPKKPIAAAAMQIRSPGRSTNSLPPKVG
ncbi:hypothetical protein ONR75_24035 [Rhodopseudomonas sp. P2A-2r]|uniref:hypothetical protein n=1 Tax=Rhodopseudomonas sp. P2A-2r TaxID=2991972 RepID=UPI002234AF23|nr:hypothetical protein [Rhodopseudomonas sp. P2A-2r]UZE47909.1 hypothetical protein ONR75_24035 [Rhodopseudomonas sp. P2A-2r]